VLKEEPILGHREMDGKTGKKNVQISSPLNVCEHSQKLNSIIQTAQNMNSN
jgi:hypothetical protein